MPEIQANRGEVRTTTRRPSFSDVLKETLATERTNVSSLARVIRWPKESVENYEHGKTTPKYERLLIASRSRRMPPVFLRLLLEQLSDGQFLIVPVPDATPHDQASGLRELMLAMASKGVEIPTRFERYAADHHIDATEQAHLKAEAGTLHGLVGRVFRAIQALGRGGGRVRP